MDGGEEQEQGVLVAWAVLTGVLGWKLANCCNFRVKSDFYMFEKSLKKKTTEENVTEDVTESLKY